MLPFAARQAAGSATYWARLAQRTVQSSSRAWHERLVRSYASAWSESRLGGGRRQGAGAASLGQLPVHPPDQAPELYTSAQATPWPSGPKLPAAQLTRADQLRSHQPFCGAAHAGTGGARLGATQRSRLGRAGLG